MKYVCLEQRLIVLSAECPETGCWVWLGQLDHKGYGRLTIRVDGKPQAMLAHRVAYQLFHGIILPDDLTLDHRCLQRRCIHPNHLQPETRPDNTRLMWARRHFADTHGIAAPF